MADNPRRIQRKRTKGWRMPPNTVYVGRPTKWGNPFISKANHKSRALAVRVYRMGMRGRWSAMEELLKLRTVPTFMLAMQFQTLRNSLGELRGKNLACWCPLDQPCHADVLLELANG